MSADLDCKNIQGSGSVKLQKLNLLVLLQTFGNMDLIWWHLIIRSVVDKLTALTF